MLGGDTKNVMDGDTGDGLMTSVRMSDVEMTRTLTPARGHRHSQASELVWRQQTQIMTEF